MSSNVNVSSSSFIFKVLFINLYNLVCHVNIIVFITLNRFFDKSDWVEIFKKINHHKNMSKKFLKNIGKIIKDLRKEQNLSQEKLAEKVGISRNYMGMIERAEVNIPVLTLYKLAKILEIEPYKLLI